MNKRLSKKYKKFSITLVLLLVCFIISTIMLAVANKKFTDSLEDIGGEIPQKIKATQEAYLRKNEALLKTIAVRVKEYRNDIDIEKLGQFIQNYSEILKVEDSKMYAIIDNKFYDFGNQNNHEDYTQEEWYKKVTAAEKGQVIYGNATYDNITNESVVTSAMRVKGTNTILAIDIFPERITTWADIGIFPEGASYYITDSVGTVIHQDSSSSDENLDDIKKNIVDIYLELGINENQIADIPYVEDTINKNAGLFAIETYNGWNIIVKIPYAEMLDGTRTILIAYYASTILFSCLALYLTFVEKKTAKGKRLYTKITNVLSDSYYALYLVDYEKERYTILKGSEYIQSIPQTGDYSSFIELIGNIMEEEAYKDFKDTFSIENIRRLISNDVKCFGGDFKRAFNSEFKWVNVRMLYSKEYVQNNNTEVIFAFQDADVRKGKEMEEREILRQSIETMQSATQSKNRFFANMSHDMRTPLNAIINLSNMARDQFNDSERVMDYLNKINISSTQLLELINNILEISKLEENMPLIHKTKFNIVQSLKDTLSVFEEQAVIQQKNLYVSCNIKNNYVLSDWGKIRQIINNIVSNALKYTRKGGNIRIEIEEIEGKFVSKYVFKVIDNGIGMTKEFLKKIYTPFARETRFHGEEVVGTGLGMVIVHNNVQTLNGQIEINSEPGKGSSVYVVLPLEISKEAEEYKENDKDEDVGVLTGKRILLVEDNELNMEIATELLEMQGVKVVKAFDGKQAVETFSQSQEGYFDAILMDVKMPIMDGYEATAHIRKLPRRDAKSIVILAVTANAFAEDIMEAKKAGMNAHIAKPVDFKELQKALTECMKKG